MVRKSLRINIPGCCEDTVMGLYLIEIQHGINQLYINDLPPAVET